MLKNEPDIYTETAIAEEFADLNSYGIRYDHKRSRFLLWGKHYWREDKTQAIVRIIMDHAKILYARGKEEKNKELMSCGIKLQAHAKIKNIMSLIKAVNPIPLTGDEFDTSPMLLGVGNGIIDLETGELRSGRQDDYISLSANINYDKKASCEKWEKFLSSIFDNNNEVIHFMQKALGYSITASMKEQIVFLCYGTGANGKSVLFSVLRNILGGYAATASSSMFKKNPFNSNSTDTADLDRKRLVVNSENITDMKLDEEKLKSISGGDPLTTRRLYENYFTYNPVCKIWLFTNHKPKVDDDSIGFWRRMRVINFPHYFDEKSRTNDMDKILLEESSGILNWLIDGCLMWQQEGLVDVPESIRLATNEYRQENNPLTEYINDQIVFSEGGKVFASILYLHYKMWAQGARKKLLSQTMFGIKIAEFNTIEKIREMDGYYYYGIKTVNS